MSTKSETPLLLLNDGRVGHWRQVTALADRLSPQQDVLDVRVHQPWRAFAPRSLPFGLAAHRGLVRGLPPLPPAAILSCGRRSALVMRWLSRHWGRSPRTVQILDCGIDPSHFDYVIVPRHDQLAGRNVVRIRGSLNPVDDNWLEQAALDACPAMTPERSPRFVLLAGGPSRHFRFDRGWFSGCLAGLGEAALDAGGSLTVVASPRTPAWVRAEAETLGARLAGGFVAWDDSPETAACYRAALALATHVVASADSVNLLSEACATGKPVFVLGADRVRGRVSGFVRGLLEDGYALELSALPEALRTARRTRSLRETAAVAVRLQRSGIFG